MEKREFLNEVIEAAITEEVTAFALSEIEKMDKANAARRAKTEERRERDLPLIEKITDILTDEPMTATEVGQMVGRSTQKATILLKALVEEGIADRKEVKIPKKGKVFGYFAI